MGTQLADRYATDQIITAMNFADQGPATLTEVISGTHLMTGIAVVVDITAVGGAPTSNVYIQKELPDGTYADIAHITGIAGVGKRYCDISVRGVVGVDKAYADASLAAGTVNALLFGKSIRIKNVITGVGATSTGKITVQLFK